jgi:hypothetical protein
MTARPVLNGSSVIAIALCDKIRYWRVGHTQIHSHGYIQLLGFRDREL